MSRIFRIAGRTRSRPILIVLTLAAAVLAGPGTARSGPAANDLPTLNIVYNAGGTISVTLADGTPVGTPSAPGTVIPPGTYSVVFNNKAEVVHMFHLSGPGVKLITDLRPIGEDLMCAGITGLYTLQTYQETFLPNSTYSFQDDYAPNLIHAVFSTSGASSAVGTTKSNTGSGHLLTGSSSFSGITSNGGAPGKGVLAGSVGANGVLRLSYDGTSVGLLKAGRYTISIVDRSSKDGFILRKGSRPAVVVAPAGFVGKRSRQIDLTVGQWVFYATGSAKKTYFVVHT